MSIKIKFSQKELKRRVAYLLNIHERQVLMVTATMGGKSFLVLINEGHWESSWVGYCQGYKESTRTLTIWEIVNCLPLDDIKSEVNFVDVIAELKEHLKILGLTEYPKDLNVLKNVYRQKAKESHPDCGGNNELFRAIQNSYEILKSYHGSFFAQNS